MRTFSRSASSCDNTRAIWGMNFDGDFVLARQYLIDALKIEPNNLKVLEYILITFPGCPDSTFSDDEIEKFRERFEKLNREKNL